MEKQSLRVNWLVRTNYGPYSLGVIPNPGDLVEVSIGTEIKRILGLYYKDKMAEAQARLEKASSKQKVKKSKEK